MPQLEKALEYGLWYGLVVSGQRDSYWPGVPPTPDIAFLYRCFDSSRVLLYIGVAGHVGRRLSQHEYMSPWHPEVESVTIEPFGSRVLALKAERHAIRRERPRHNVVHNVRNSSRPLNPYQEWT